MLGTCLWLVCLFWQQLIIVLETICFQEEMRNPRELIDTEGTAVPKKDLPEVAPYSVT